MCTQTLSPNRLVLKNILQWNFVKKSDGYVFPRYLIRLIKDKSRAKRVYRKKMLSFINALFYFKLCICRILALSMFTL